MANITQVCQYIGILAKGEISDRQSIGAIVDHTAFVISELGDEAVLKKTIDEEGISDQRQTDSQKKVM